MSKKKKDAPAMQADESPTEEELMMLQALEESADEAGDETHGAPAQPPASRPRPRTGLASLYDLTLPVSIELGRTEMMIEDVLKLSRGSVIELERLAGEPIDIFVGDRLFAEGEVVVVDEHFGVRVTRVLDVAVEDEQAN